MSSPSSSEQTELARDVAEACLLRGEFTLRSGRKSSYYLDKYRFSTRPGVLARVAEQFSDRVKALGRVDRLAGAELGGIPLVTATGLVTGHPLIFVRNAKKDYGTAKQLEGDLNAGDRVVFLEDVATTGGQALEAVQVLREAGAEVVAVIAAIDREEGARENVKGAGVVFDALFTKRDLGVEEE